MARESDYIKKAKAGDKEAFCLVYDLYKDRLYRYALYRLGSEQDAEDAVSECVLSAWKQIGGLRSPEAFPGWIFRILSACCGRIIKKQIAEREKIDGLKETAGSGTAGMTDGPAPADSLALREALDSLTQEERDIVLLSVVAGLKSNEISQISGLAAGSVRSSLSRSLKKMRGYLE